MQEPSEQPKGYLRPHDRFSCEHQDGCRRGPSPRGECCAEEECTPQQLGDRWVCRRSIARGGPCVHGPGPHGECGMPVHRCQPRSNLRARRGQIVLLSVASLVAFLSVLSGSAYQGALLAPGPLCSAHAVVLGKESGLDRCSRCHDLANQGVGQWIATLFSRNAIGPVTSEKCLACHDATLPRSAARNPHNLPAEQIAQLTQEQRERNEPTERSLVGEFATRLVSHSGNQFECATCHREHQSGEQLSHLTNQQCQVCHTKTFHSFELDHPEFVAFGTSSRGQIAFEHASHEFKHFREKGIAYSCQLCHAPDPTRQAMRLKSFQQACAQCHTQTIEVASLDGLELLRLPALDVETLRAAGLEIGDWPAEISDQFDGALSPATLLLLAGDSRVRQAIETLGGEVDFSVLDDTDPAELTAAYEVAWGLKRLIWELSSGDQEGLRKRLDALKAPDSATRRKWLTALPSSHLEDMAAIWLPDLEFELNSIETASATQANTVRLPSLSEANQSLAANAVGPVNDPQDVPALSGETLSVRSVGWSQTQQERLAENPLRTMVLRSQPAVAGPGVDVPGVDVAANDQGIAVGEAQALDPPESASGDSLASDRVMPEGTRQIDPPQNDATPLAALPHNPLRANQPNPFGLPDLSASPEPAVGEERSANDSPTDATPEAPRRALVAGPPNPSGERLADNPIADLLGSSKPADEPNMPSNEALSSNGSSSNGSLNDGLSNDASSSDLASDPPQVNAPQLSIDATNADGAVEQVEDQERLTAGATEGAADSGLPLNSLETNDEREAENRLTREDGEVLPWRYSPTRHVGWVRDDRSRTLVYYPSGHEDQNLVHWLNFIASLRFEHGSSLPLSVPSDQSVAGDRSLALQLVAWQEEEAAAQLPDRLVAALENQLSPLGVGACGKCHTTIGSTLAWQGVRREVNRSQFTNFSHGPHLSLEQLRDCRSCHRLTPHDQPPLDSTEAVGVGLSASRGDFVNMNRSDCATCHQAGAASNGCTTCHDYHIGVPMLGRWPAEALETTRSVEIPKR